MKTNVSRLRKIISDIDYQLRPDEVLDPKQAKALIEKWTKDNIGIGRVVSIKPIKKAVECVIVFNQADLAQISDDNE